MGIILPCKFITSGSINSPLAHLFTSETLFLTYIKLYHATLQVVLAIEKREMLEHLIKTCIIIYLLVYLKPFVKIFLTIICMSTCITLN